MILFTDLLLLQEIFTYRIIEVLVLMMLAFREVLVILHIVGLILCDQILIVLVVPNLIRIICR